MKKIPAFILALLLLIVFSGCGTTKGGTANGGDNALESNKPDPEPQDSSHYKFAAGKFKTDENGLALEKYEYELPLSTTDETFTYWFTNFTPEYLPEEGYGASELPVEAEKRTGVHIEYVLTAFETMAENFSILLSADNLCDITCNAKGYYTGNFREVVGENGYFVNIYDYRAYMPNYIYEATKDPADIDTRNAVFTEDNLILSVYELKKEPTLTDGPFARGDWMQKLGMVNTDIVTFDDLYEMLMGFKTQIGVEYPMTLYKTLEVVGCNEWVGYDTYCFVSDTKNVYVMDGKVRLANMNENDFELMSMINKWYSDGLIDPNWTSYTGTQDIDDKIDSGKIGYLIGGGVSISAHNGVIPADATVGWVPLSKPLKTEGQTLHMGFNLPRVSWGSAAVSAKCTNIELVCTWLDYRYSESGSFLYGYGIEGLTYEYDENGELWITDFIVNHPAYWGMIMCTYALNTIFEPGLEIDYSLCMKINADIPQLLEFWMSTPHDDAYVFPLGVSYTSDQTDQLAQYSVDINTYISENYLAFVDGSKPLSEWDDYVKTLNDIGVTEVINIHQEAYEAYMAKALD